MADSNDLATVLAQQAVAQDPQQAWQKASAIGPAQIGDHIIDSPWQTSKVLDLVRRAMAGSNAERPWSVASQDPLGLEEYNRTGQLPPFAVGATTEGGRPPFEDLWGSVRHPAVEKLLDLLEGFKANPEAGKGAFLNERLTGTGTGLPPQSVKLPEGFTIGGGWTDPSRVSPQNPSGWVKQIDTPSTAKWHERQALLKQLEANKPIQNVQTVGIGDVLSDVTQAQKAAPPAETPQISGRWQTRVRTQALNKLNALGLTEEDVLKMRALGPADAARAYPKLNKETVKAIARRDSYAWVTGEPESK